MPHRAHLFSLRLGHAVYDACIKEAYTRARFTQDALAGITVGIIAIPLAGMIIGNTMNGASLAAERLASEIRERRDEMETALCLGASSRQTADTAVRNAFRAAPGDRHVSAKLRRFHPRRSCSRTG